MSDGDFPSRPGTTRTCLYMLGYLREDSGSRENDPGLTKAIRTFQRDAGLAIDGRAGPETHAALDDLANFTRVPDLARWAATDAETGLLRRAVGARLQMLGLLAKHTRCKAAIRSRLRTFAEMACASGEVDLPLRPKVSLAAPETSAILDVLFDPELAGDLLAAYRHRSEPTVPSPDSVR